jgi:hypothetical protein
LESLKGRDHPEDLGVDGKIILKLILEKYSWRVWTGLIWLRIDSGDGSREHGTECYGSIKGGEFDQLSVACEEGLSTLKS